MQSKTIRENVLYLFQQYMISKFHTHFQIEKISSPARSVDG